MLPYELWIIIIDYLPAVTLIRIEKTWRAFYFVWNSQWKECDHENLTLNSSNFHIFVVLFYSIDIEWTNSWRLIYNQLNDPFNDKFSEPSCHLQKYLISRYILEEEYPCIIAKAYEFFCKRKMHIYINAKTEGVLCWLIWRVGIIPSNTTVSKSILFYSLEKTKITSNVKSCLHQCTYHNKNENIFHWLMKIDHPQKDHLWGICVNQGKYKREAQKYVNYINGIQKEGELNLARPEKPILKFFDQI